MPVLALDDDREQATQVVEAEIRTAIREGFINSVVLGCAGMVHITDNRGDTSVLSCVDGSFYARVNLSDFDVCRLRSCVRPFDAVDNTAGLDEVRALGPNQISELVSPDSASGCPNFSFF